MKNILLCTIFAASTQLASCAAHINFDKSNGLGNQRMVSQYPTLTDAINEIDAVNKTTLVLDVPTRLTADTVVPENIEVIGTINGKVELGEFNLKIEGLFDVRPYQVFSGNGNVDILNNAVEIFYPQWWGALADGKHDDSASILKALDAAGRRGGGSVKLPRGKYFCTKTLMVPSYVKFYGDGIDNTIIVNPAGGIHGYSNGGWISASVGAVGTTHSTISDMTIDHMTNGTNTNGVSLVPTGKHEGVIPKGIPTTYALIERVKVLGYQTHQYLIWSQGAQHVRIANNIIDGGQATLSKKSIGQDGIEIYGGDDVVVEGNTVIGVEGTGIWTFSDETPYSNRLGIRVIGNYVTQSRSCIGGANSSEAKHIHYKDNVVRNCWTTGISFNAINGVRLQDIQIAGNSISDVTAQGISLHGGTLSEATDEAIFISGNVISNVGQSGIVISNHSNVKIVSNTISRAETGIFVSSSSPGAVNISLENNTISRTRKEGINVYYARQVEVLGNVVKDYNLNQNNHAGIYFHAGEYLMAARNILKYGGKKEATAILSYAENVGLYENTLQYPATLTSPFSNLGKNARYERRESR